MLLCFVRGRVGCREDCWESVGRQTNLSMSDVDITTLPISKLRNELKKLGLSGSGTKNQLIERYNTYKQQQAENPAATAKEEDPVVEAPQEASPPVTGLFEFVWVYRDRGGSAGE